MVEEVTVHIKVYIDADNKHTEQNFDMLATCILASVYARTRSKLHAIYENLKIGGIVYDELFFKGMTKKDISNNKKTTRYLQDQYENLPSYMTNCDSDIAKFILEWRNIVILLEARGVVLTDKFKILWRAFEICKETQFFEYMGHKQEAHEED